MLDSCLFIPNISAAVIAQDKNAANVIFRKIKFAYDNLPPAIRAMCPLQRESVGELILANKSSMRVATSVRSATLQFLHVSEFGKICAKYPAKAQEVVTGSLPAAQNGIIFIESTAEGREGAFYEMTQKARASRESKKELGHLEYRFHFASWWEEKRYQADPASVTITQAEHDYFDKIETFIGVPLDPAQRAWYIGTRDNELGGDWALMKQEYPSTPDEAFEQSQEGVYYAAQLAAARRQAASPMCLTIRACRSTRSGTWARMTTPASGSTSTLTAGTTGSTITNAAIRLSATTPASCKRRGMTMTGTICRMTASSGNGAPISSKRPRRC